MDIERLSIWLDRVDPYGYSRLMALKSIYIAIVLFIANLFLRPPMASLVMLIAGAGIIIIELPSINTFKKKDTIYLAYIILVSLTIALFAAYVYIPSLFILFAACWCYILYSLISKNPALFPIGSVILMLGLISLKGYNSGNFYLILNELIFFAEFAVIVFWAHKLFPNFYYKVWHKATILSIETMQNMLKNQHSAESRTLFKHYYQAKNVLPLLTKFPQIRQMVAITNWLSYYHYYLADLLSTSSSDRGLLATLEHDLQILLWAFKNGKKLPKLAFACLEDGELSSHQLIFSKIRHKWNKLC